MISLYRTLRRILPRAVLRSPPRADVAIFDAAGAETLLEGVLQGIKTTVLPARGEQYFLSPKVLWRLFMNIGRYPRDIFYYASCLDAIRPKVVMTYIDNANRFHKLSRCYSGPAFFCVQNGSRDLRCATEGDEYSTSDYFCFGQWEEDLFKSFSDRAHKIDHYRKIGSLRLSKYRTEVESEPCFSAEEFDLCLITNYKISMCEGEASNWPIDEHTPTRRSLQLLHDHLARFVRETGHTLCIAGTLSPSEEKKKEEEFYKHLFGSQATFIPNSKSDWSTFKAIESSRLSICFNSTAGFEGLALNRKVLFCNYTSQSALDTPWPGPWAITDPTYELFAARVEELLAMPMESFLEKSILFARYLFGDYGRFDGHKVLRSAIEARIG